MSARKTNFMLRTKPHAVGLCKSSQPNRELPAGAFAHFFFVRKIQADSPRDERAESQPHDPTQATRARTMQKQVRIPREPPAGAAPLTLRTP